MSNNSSPWDPTSLTLVQSEAKSPAPPVRRGRKVSPIKDKFIKGPVDVRWLSQARKLGVSALWVGLGLWFLRGLKRSDSVVVSNLMLEDFGVLPDAKNRALRKLEKAGLIAVERKGKRSPLVTLIVPKDDGTSLNAASRTSPFPDPMKDHSHA